MKLWNDFKKTGDRVVYRYESKIKSGTTFLGMLSSLGKGIFSILKIILIIASITLGVSFVSMLLGFISLILK